MAHPGPESTTEPRDGDGGYAAWVARAGRRLGAALVGAGVPAAVATVAVGVSSGSTRGPLQWVGAAMGTSVLAGSGLAWAFHVAALTALVGVWTVGLALVVEGYYGVE